MKTIEYRRIPLAHNYSQYMAVSDPAEFLALEGNNVVFNEKAERVGLNCDYKVMCVYEVEGETKRIDYQYEMWGGFKHLSERLKAALKPVLKEEFA